MPVVRLAGERGFEIDENFQTIAGAILDEFCMFARSRSLSAR
jgi:hypothetical protein